MAIHKRRRISSKGEAINVIKEPDWNELNGDKSNSPSHGVDKPQLIPNKSLFIQLLPETVTAKSLTEFFSQSYPLKHATVVVDPLTKKSKGYAFVTFADSEDARRARDEFDGSLFEGRKIKVKPAERRHRALGEVEKGSKKRNYAAMTAAEPKLDGLNQQLGEQRPSTKLIIRNLPWTIKESEQLAALFRSYGKVIHAAMPKKQPGLSAGFGFVVIRGMKNAERALQGVNGKEVEGRKLAVDWAVEKEVWETLQAADEGKIAQSRPYSVARKPNSSPNVEPEGHDESLDLGSHQLSDSEETRSESEAGQEFVQSETPQRSSSDEKDLNKYTLFIRNLPYNVTDEVLYDHFSSFGPVRYARIVLDPTTERSKGVGFVCFHLQDHVERCLRGAPQTQSTQKQGITSSGKMISPATKKSLLEDLHTDQSGLYTLQGRVIQVSRALEKSEAERLAISDSTLRDQRDKNKRRLYLLTEGTILSNSPLYGQLSSSEIKLRENSARQRQNLVKSNPSLHLSLTRLSIRNIPRAVTSKMLKALGREAVVGFAKDVKAGIRQQLSKEEIYRGGDESREAEKIRKAKGKGIVKQAKIVFEGKEGHKVAETSGAGRSRGYGFIEYTSHRWALMGLRWLNGYAIGKTSKTDQNSGDSRESVKDKKKKLVVEFAIENSQVLGRRQENEARARQRSKYVLEKRASGEQPIGSPKALSKDQLMAKTRKGMKRKLATGKPSMPKPAALFSGAEETHNYKLVNPDKLAKHQSIIGKKRMIRKLKRRT